MKICVLSGRYPKSEFSAYENHKVYSSQHGYYYINCNWPTIASNPYYNKLYYSLHYLDLFDFIFWIDDDAFFWDLNRSLDQFIPKGEKILSICKSPDNKNIKTLFNSGIFMLKCNYVGKLFIQAALETDLEIVKKWWVPEFGYFTGGDQDAFVFQYKTNQDYSDKFEIYHHSAFNSRYYELENFSNVFIIHLTGTRIAKLETLLFIIKKFSLTENLITLLPSIEYKIIKHKLFVLKFRLAFLRLKKVIR